MAWDSPRTPVRYIWASHLPVLDEYRGRGVGQANILSAWACVFAAVFHCRGRLTSSIALLESKRLAVSEIGKGGMTWGDDEQADRHGSGVEVVDSQPVVSTHDQPG